MKHLRISEFSLSELNTLIDIIGKNCDKIFLTKLSVQNHNLQLISEIKEHILDSEKVSIWDGTELGIDVDSQDGIIPDEVKSIRYLVDCNDKTTEILKKYIFENKRGLFSRESYFDIAFYNINDCLMFTTAHEDSICFNEKTYAIIEKEFVIKK